MNIAPQGLHFLYLRDAAAGIHAETTEQSGQRVSLSEMGGEEWPSGENTITSVCVPRCHAAAAVRAQVSINKMESVMDDQAEIFQIRQKLDRLTFLTNFLA